MVCSQCRHRADAIRDQEKARIEERREFQEKLDRMTRRIAYLEDRCMRAASVSAQIQEILVWQEDTLVDAEMQPVKPKRTNLLG